MRDDHILDSGTATDIVPKGDRARQAVDSLRGYAYQVLAATLAWIDIGNKDRIYLEVAEDYAEVAGSTLTAVQVKDTIRSGSVTLNSESVRRAITAFVDLCEQNPGIRVELRFLTTSNIGTEKAATDRPTGMPGLEYWRKAATGADPSPLRAMLESGKSPDSVREFSRSRDDNALRRDLIQRIHWDCGKPDFLTLHGEIEERLAVVGRDRFGIPSQFARRLVDSLVFEVLKKAVAENAQDRFLTGDDLFRAIDGFRPAAPPFSPPEALLRHDENLGSLLGGDTGSAALFYVGELDLLIDGSELPGTKGIIPRDRVESTMNDALGNFGAAVLVGGSGFGKSVISRRLAAERADSFFIADFRNLDAEKTRHRLNMVFARVGGLPPSLLILEDLNHLDDERVAFSLGRVIEALRRRRREVIVTCYREPSLKALLRFALSRDCVVNCPYFSKEETRALVLEYEGDPETWGNFAHAAGASGHPQLTHAFVVGMAARGWPTEEMEKVLYRGLSSEETDAERDAARRSLATALPEDTRNLLYRLSLAIGKFDRSLALTLGKIFPQVPQPGECVDQLIGPWIEAVGSNMFRVSPLANRFGYEMLSPDERNRIHRAMAVQMIKRKKVRVSDIDMIIMHAIQGKSTEVLTGVAAKILATDSETLAMSAEHILFFRFLRTDAPVYPENPMVSATLRLAQLKLAAAAGEGNSLSEIATAFFNEAGNITEDELRRLLEGAAMVTLLSTMGIANYLDDWVAVLCRFGAMVETEDCFQHLRAENESGSNLLGELFAVGSTGLSSVERLEHVIDQLDGLDPAERSLLLAPADKMFSDYFTFIHGPWIARESLEDFDAIDTMVRYRRMEEKTRRWGIRPLSLQCWTAQAVMLDEYQDDSKGAMAVLEEAVSTMGPDPILSRSMAKVYWKQGNHGKVLEIIRDIEDRVGGDNLYERAYALREAAISAAECGEWEQSEKWFVEAQNAAGQDPSANMKVMAVGLSADSAVAAFEAGGTGRALERLAEALGALANINPEATLHAAHCHRLIRHTVLWMKSRIEKREGKIQREPIATEPGVCSNPDPLPVIREQPLTDIDTAWYMLAEAEIEAGLDMGITATLHSRLERGQISKWECRLRRKMIQANINRLDAVGFAVHLKPYAEAAVYLSGERPQAPLDPLSPERGEIPALDMDEPLDSRAERTIKDAILAYGVNSVFANRSMAMKDLKTALHKQFAGPFPGESVFDHTEENLNSLAELDKIAISLTEGLFQNEHVTPYEFWSAGLGLFNWINQSNFKDLLTARLAVWQRFRWKLILTEESFRLCSPSQTVPAIREVLKIPMNDQSFVAKLFLATSDAVGVALVSEHRNILKAIAEKTGKMVNLG